LKEVTDIATPSEIIEQLESFNLELLFKDLVNYALNRMKGNNIIDAEEIVGDVFEKVVSGVRNWKKEKTFKHFLFESVKSLVSQYNGRFGKKIKDFDYNFEFNQLLDDSSNDSEQLEELIKKVTEKLENHIPPPDEIEKMVFECWINEIRKPREVKEFWELDIKDVRKAIKRLERKLNPIIVQPLKYPDKIPD